MPYTTLIQPMITVSQLTKTSQENVKELELLSSMLHGDERYSSSDEITDILLNPSIVFIVAKDEERIIGMGSLYFHQKVGKLASYIEDVVVDDAYRGQGLGAKIVQTLIDAGRERGALSITLTSRPERVPAHKLYEKLGFKKYDTNVFRLIL